MNRTVNLWISSGLVWVVLTMCYGMYLGMTQQFHLSSSHAHPGLLGGLWAIAFAFLYSRAGGRAEGIIPIVQWLMYNAGVAWMATMLYLVNTGKPVGPLIAIGGALITVSTLWIAIRVWPRGDALVP